VCQAHIRSLSSKVAVKENEELITKQSVSVASTSEIKKHLNDINSSLNDADIDDGEKSESLKLARLLDRKKRKLERIERKAVRKSTPRTTMKTRYINCTRCKNPKSHNCEHNLCRMCCKDKVFIEKIECKGHGLRARNTSESGQFDSNKELVENTS